MLRPRGARERTNWVQCYIERSYSFQVGSEGCRDVRAFDCCKSEVGSTEGCTLMHRQELKLKAISLNKPEVRGGFCLRPQVLQTGA